MSSERLSTELDWSTDADTVIDTPTPLQTWDVPDGAVVILESGGVVIMDAETTSGNTGPAGGDADPSRETVYALAYREPDDPIDAWTVFTEELPQTPFTDLSLKDQQSGENAQNRRLVFDARRPSVARQMTFEDADEIALMANGPDAIDGSESQFNYPMRFVNR